MSEIGKSILAGMKDAIEGRGKISTLFLCRHCRGTGRIKLWWQQGHVACPRCDGTGEWK